jgi:hypothetical protein
LSTEQWCDRNQPSIDPQIVFVQSVGLLIAWIQGPQKRLIMVRVHGLLVCPPFLYSILFYAVLFYVYITDTNVTSLDKQSSLADSL